MIGNEIDLRYYRSRINVSDYFELRSWAKRFGVTAGGVRRAVTLVGDSPKDVEAHLECTRSADAMGPGNRACPLG